MIKYDCRDDSFVAHAQLPRISDMRQATQKSTYGIGSKLFNTQIKLVVRRKVVWLAW